MANPLTQKPYSCSWKEIVEELSVAPEKGLSQPEIRKRLQQYGSNELRKQDPRSSWSILANQFKSVVVLLLVGATVISIAMSDYTEAVAILVVILINTAIGFFTEIKAIRSMEALYKMGSVVTRVRREGQMMEVPASDLVPGDVIVLEGGDLITADLRIIEASKLQCDESILTGESVPVSKNPKPVDENQPLAERHNMLYKGTSLTRGSGMAIVTATGMDTELGQISTLVEEVEDETTPLEKNLNALGRHLVWVVFLITVLVWVVGVARGKDLFLMLETAIALAVASIPEGLPIVATIALSRGMLRMARQQALVRRLASVETLGSTNIICTDKTGTLTENRMTVTRLITTEGRIGRQGDSWITEQRETVSWKEESVPFEAFKIGVLCNNASLGGESSSEEKAVGDPLEIALLRAAQLVGINSTHLIQEMPEVREDAFDSESKKMATFNQEGDNFYVSVKGAPEFLLKTCRYLLTSEGEIELTQKERGKWIQRNEEMALEGYRVLALARKKTSQKEEDPYSDLALVGLLGMEDPPRSDIRPTIERCHQAGIQVVMVTGDQAATALNIGTAVGIVSQEEARVVHGKDLKPLSELSSKEKERLRKTSLFARVDPRQKLDLIALHQEQGSIVAMTGDGVNDAPALKKANIGIAMGNRGTQVAQQAAHVVLKDDSFKTIVHAIQEGRVIFNNIRKFVLFLLSCNIAEVLVILLASLFNTPLPILPLQILLLNLVTDVFPALALGVGEGNEQVMSRPPRKSDESLLSRKHWGWISFYGAMIGLSTFAAFLLAYYRMDLGLTPSITISFLTLAFSQLFHVFNLRDFGTSFIKNEITRNLYVWGAFVLCTIILLLTLYIPALATVLHTVPLGLNEWLIVLIASIAPCLFDLMIRGMRSFLPS